MGSFSHLAPTAGEAMGEAQAIAHAMGHDYLGTEHVLLALLTIDTGLATHALGAVGVSAAAARTQLLALLGGPQEPSARCRHKPSDGALAVMPRLKQSLERAVREAHGDTILAEHLLLGLLADPEALAVRVLLALGVAPEELARRVRDDLGGETTPP